MKIIKHGNQDKKEKELLEIEKYSYCPECNNKFNTLCSIDKTIGFFRTRRIRTNHFKCLCGCEWITEQNL